jgi:GT2 family glycosyltransferase
LTACLEALAGQDLPDPYEVLVVLDEDGPEPDLPPGARVVREPRLGPSAKRNRGAREARAEVLAFTDPDCRPEPHWLREGLSALDAADLVQGAVRPPEGAVYGPFDRLLWVEREVGLYETANLFVRRWAFERAGGFRPIGSFEQPRPDGRVQHFGEDVAFAWRAKRAGARSAFASRALVRHAVFTRGPAGFVAERLRLRFFPLLTREAPELRGTMYCWRVFLSPRSAAFDAAVAGAALALGRRSLLPLVVALPYARLARRHARMHAGGSLKALTVAAAADAVGLAALAWGSVRYREAVL